MAGRPGRVRRMAPIPLRYEGDNVSVRTWSMVSRSSSLVMLESNDDPVSEGSTVVQRVEVTSVVEEVVQVLERIPEMEELDENDAELVAALDDGNSSGGLLPFIPPLYSSPIPEDYSLESEEDESVPAVPIISRLGRISVIADQWQSPEVASYQARLVADLADSSEDLGIGELWPDLENPVEVNLKIDLKKNINTFPSNGFYNLEKT